MSYGFHRLGSNVKGKPLPVIAPMIDTRRGFVPADVPAVELKPIEQRASPAAPADMALAPIKQERLEARHQGYTGDQCSHCSSMRMKISGHCMVCENCGTTTGCS